MKTLCISAYINNNNQLFIIDTAEKELLSAILRRAIEDHLLQKNKPISSFNRIHADKKGDAKRWLIDTSHSQVGSIRWVLDYISTDTDRALQVIYQFIKNNDTLLCPSRARSHTRKQKK